MGKILTTLRAESLRLTTDLSIGDIKGLKNA